MASSTISPTKPKGGSFLIEPTSPEQLFSPEDFTDEHRAIARTTEEFWTKEIAPNVEAIQHQEPGVAVSVLRKAGEIGLTSVHLPEKYGGMEMDLTSAMLVAEGIAKDGSYAAWHGGQAASAHCRCCSLERKTRSSAIFQEWPPRNWSPLTRSANHRRDRTRWLRALAPT